MPSPGAFTSENALADQVLREVAVQQILVEGPEEAQPDAQIPVPPEEVVEDRVRLRIKALHFPHHAERRLGRVCSI